MYLKDKVVIVTGSNTGIGAAIAKACVAAGACVMIHGRNQQRAEAMLKILGEDKAAYYLCRLSAHDNVAHCHELLAATVDRFGRVDALVNNAALSHRNDIDMISSDEFDMLIRLNLKAPLFLTQVAVKQFRKQGGGGTILNIGSLNAYCGQADLLAYSMTKGGLMTMTRNLGNALGQEGVRVNQLNVGWTLTENEIKLKQKEGFPEAWEKKIPATYMPSGKLLRPEDIARYAVFWLSEQSAPVNGSVCEVEQYPMGGRNLVNEIPLSVFDE